MMERSKITPTMPGGACKILLLLLLSCVSIMHGGVLDSLKNVYRHSPSDTNAVNLLTEIMWQSRSAHEDDSIVTYFKQAEAMATSLSFKRGLATANRYVGDHYLDVGELTDAIAHFEKAEALFTQLNEPKNVGKSLNSKANTFREMGKYPEALKAYFAAIKQFEKIHDTLNVVICKTNLATVYRKLKNFNESLKLFNEALEYFIKVNDPYTGYVYNNIANLYSDQGQVDESIRYFREALKTFEREKSNSGMSIACNNIGTAYVRAGNMVEAYKSFTAALALKEAIKDKKGIANTSNNIAAVLLKMGKLKEADRYLKKSIELCRQVGALEVLANYYRVKCDLDSATGNYRGALESYQLYITCRDSLLNNEVIREGVQQQMQYEFDKREAETQIAQSKKDAIAAEEKRRQELILWAVAGGLALLMLFSALMFRALRLKQKANKEIMTQKQIIEQKQQEIVDSIHYARRIQQALITSENYISKHLKKLRKSV